MTKVAIDVEACRAYLRARQRREAEQQEALRQQVTQAVRTAAAAILPRFPQVRRAYLFGSTLHALRTTSDVDIAVEGELSAEEYFALWRELDRAVPDWLIDLVELGRDLHFADRVRMEGEVIYERSGSDAEGGYQS
ncbi:MAG: nucleotidyltransferase domain-containing protein [Anaerolineae bacterium]